MVVSPGAGVNSLSSDVRGQTGWAWKIALYLALSSAGAGADLAWQVGRNLDPTWGSAARPGVALGVGLALVGALFVLLDLGRWSRFYRAAVRPTAAWISRGFLLLLAFDLLGILQVASWILGLDGWDLLPSVLAVLLALALLFYGGLLLRSSRPFPLWTDPLQVGLYAVSGLLAGCGTLALDPLRLLSPAHLQALAAGGTVLSALGALLLAAFLMRVRGVAPAGRASVEMLLHGRPSGLFWIGAVGLGLALPLVLWAGGAAGILGSDLVRAAGASALVGLLLLRYAVLAAAHRPTALSFRGAGPWGISM